MSDVIASPSVRKRAGDLGLDLEALARDLGRTTLTADDLAGAGATSGAGAAQASASAQAAYWDVDHAAHGPVTEEPLGRIAEAAARNLGAANALIPQVTHHDRADMSAIDGLRARWRDEAAARGIKLTPLAFHVLALARTLADFPRLNASISADGKTLVHKHYVHIGIAVDTPHGLMVPVIRDADQKGLWDIAADIASLADRARNRKLSAADMGGASITISSLGPTGGTAFTPIVNPPELAILGLSATQITPVWTGETFEPKPLLPISLSYDHRAINGADAAKITNKLKQYIQKPMEMTR